MTTYRVIFEVELPDSTTSDEAEEFIRFSLGDRGDMNSNNPLAEAYIQGFHPLVTMVEEG